MGVLGGEQQGCSCYKECQEFQKLFELKDSGLAVYFHRPRADDGGTSPLIKQGEEVGGAVNASEDVFILHNKKDVKITTSQLTAEFEKENISCPRCRKAFKHAQELMQEVKSIARKLVMGICDHCRKKSRTTPKPFCVCDQIVKKFINVKGEQNEDTKKQAVTSTQPIEPHEGVHARIPAPSLADSDTSLMKTYVEAKEFLRPSLKDDKREEILEDTPSMDAKEALKRRHDLSLRQMMRLDKDTEIVPQSVPKRPEVYETAKISPWKQMDTISKSKTDIKKKPLPTKSKSNQDRRSDQDDPNRQVKFKSLKTPQEDKSLKKDEELKLQHKTKKIKQKAKSTSDSVETVGSSLKPGFSFSFPKVKEKKDKKTKVAVTSSHLMKDVKEKYRLRSEREKEKLEQAQKKKLAREEKKLQAEESKRQVLEVKKNRILTEKETAKKHESETDGAPVVAKIDTESISEQKSTTKKIEQDKSKELESEVDSEPMIAKKDTESISELQEEKTKTGKKAERSKILKEEKEGKEMEALKKQPATEKLKKKENDAAAKKEKDATTKKEKKIKVANSRKEKQENDENSKEEKQENVEISKKPKRTKKTGRDSSDEINELSMKIQKSKQKPKEPFKGITAEQFQKLKAELLREKEAKLKEKQKLLSDLQAKEEAKPKKEKGEHRISKIKIKKVYSEEMLKSIRIQEDAKKMKASNVHPLYIMNHKSNHQPSGQQSSVCLLCVDSDLELDVLSLETKQTVPKKATDIIIGENILKFKPRLEKTKKLEVVPIFFQKDFVADSDHQIKEEVQIIPEEIKSVHNKQNLKSVVPKKDLIEIDPGKGVLRYALSDRTFIDKGWTMLPIEKVVRKMNVYRMRPAHPEFDWFEHNKNKRLMTYDTGERLAEFEDSGRGRWYYRSGRLALDYYDAEETNAQQRFVIYSSGEPDVRGRTRPITILATFDYLGNGIVFDHAGKIRLKYNQTEGVVLDREIGPVTHWQWHSLNDPPVLQQVMIDTQMAHKDPNIMKLGSANDKKTHTENEEMLTIEFDNFIREKTKKLSQKFKPFQIKMKAMKINEHFALKILDQATIYLIYRDGTTNMKINIGMLLDHKEIVDTDTAEVGEVSNSLERFPARTDSLAMLQHSVANAQHYEKQRTNRERLLQLQKPCASADILTAAASPPMRLPLISMSTGSSLSTGQCTGHCSRKPTDNFYYTRFVY